ncbi:peroxiredoxin family protein [Colwellia echini]|uniref:Peroxiredoxin family protein n=2 Tax=Colwellia echini TaxID=1982103 RepID=A0ABY3MZS8_9GAMM|nr:peroxiredoxin family protein [Colwellia echini]
MFTFSAFAEANINVGPKSGISAPKISVLNLRNQPTNIEQLSSEKGLVIVFFRSADWCPYCKRHLLELNEQAQKFTDLGYGLAAISYDNTDILQKFTKEQSISYPLLSDQQAQTMQAYNILNKDYAVGDDNYGIPYPGVVVIDKEGKIVHKYFYEGYKDRVKFSDLYLQLSKGN